jgi:hypothetical protein
MNVLFQIGLGSYSAMLDLVRKRHESLADKWDAVYLQFTEAVNPLAVTTFWEKWKQVKALMEISAVKIIVACDADVIWAKDQDIFNVLPEWEDFGLTWQPGPSAGCVWIRNNERNRALVELILSLEPQFERFAGHDQSAMMRALSMNKRVEFRLPDLLHSPLENAVLQSFHCQPDRLARMEICMKNLSPIVDANRIRV